MDVDCSNITSDTPTSPTVLAAEQRARQTPTLAPSTGNIEHGWVAARRVMLNALDSTALLRSGHLLAFPRCRSLLVPRRCDDGVGLSPL